MASSGDVDTWWVEAGRPRLREYVATEDVQHMMPGFSRGGRLERGPITPANRGKAMFGPQISEEEHQVTLSAERPVVGEEAVPVEPVRLGKERRLGEGEVGERVRKERIETDGRWFVWAGGPAAWPCHRLAGTMATRCAAPPGG